jgi:fibronectin type 3 domain-containing protein
VNSASIPDTGFSIIGGSFPITLNPSATATVQVQFKPTTAGAANGKLTISSNSGSGGTVVVSLSGTGTTTAHQVNLSWTAPSNSPDPVKGYNIYRSTGSQAMTLMNAAIQTPTSYVDSTVANATSYNYVVKSVDSSGVESVGSNQIEVAVP